MRSPELQDVNVVIWVPVVADLDALARVPQPRLTFSTQNAGLSWEIGACMDRRRVSSSHHLRRSRARGDRSATRTRRTCRSAYRAEGKAVYH